MTKFRGAATPKIAVANRRGQPGALPPNRVNPTYLRDRAARAHGLGLGLTPGIDVSRKTTARRAPETWGLFGVIETC